MNLRDLIFSQPSQVSSQNDEDFLDSEDFQGDISQLYNLSSHDSFSKIIRSDSEDSIDSLSEKDIGEQISTSKHNRPKYLSNYPLHRKDISRTSKFYQECPEILHQKHLRFDGKLVEFLDGYPNFVRFPQVETSVLAYQRNLVRCLWEQCYFSQDYDGATQAFELLSEIDAIDMPDFVLFTDMLRHTANPTTALKTLIQKSFKERLIKQHVTQRATLLGMFVELLMLQNESKFAHSYLTSRIADPAFSSTDYLLAFDAIIVCNQLHEMAATIVSECKLDPPLPLPTIDAIAADPLEFYRIVLFIHYVATKPSNTRHNSSNSSAQKPRQKEITDITKQQCKSLLSDLRTAFMKCSLENGRCEWFDFHALYIAYMEGTERHRQASKHARNLSSILQTTGGQHNRHQLSQYIKLEKDNNTENNDFTQSESQPEQIQPKYSKECNIGTVLKYHHLIARYMSRFVLTTTDVSPSEFYTSVNGRRFLSSLEYIVTPREGSDISSTGQQSVTNIESLYYAVQLYRLQRLTKEQLVNIISDAIEACPPVPPIAGTTGKDTHTVEYGYNPLHWLLWRTLSCFLGAVKPMTLKAAISPTCDLAPWMPYGQEMHQSNDNNKRQRIDDVNDDVSEDGGAEAEDVKPIIKDRDFTRDRVWWTHTILALSQLGEEFSDSVLEFEAAALVKECIPVNTKSILITTEEVEARIESILSEFVNYFHATEERTNDTTFGSAAADEDNEIHSYKADLQQYRVSLCTELNIPEQSIRTGHHNSIYAGHSSSDEDNHHDGDMRLSSPSLSRVSSGQALSSLITNVSLNTLKTPAKKASVASSGLSQIGTSSVDMEVNTALNMEISGDGAADEKTLHIIHSIIEVTSNSSGVTVNRLRNALLATTQQHHEQQQHQSVGDNIEHISDAYQSTRMSYPFMSQEYLPHSTHKQDFSYQFNREMSTFNQLGVRLLEIITCQVIVRCHLCNDDETTIANTNSQDCMFVVKAIQLIVENALHTTDMRAKNTANQCIMRLITHGINVVRAIRIASLLANHDINMYTSAPTI